jgi:ketosteroid isomerase-like protein
MGKRTVSVARDTARAMSQENVERIRRFYDAWAAASSATDRAAAISEFCEPDIEWRALEHAPDAGIYRGRESLHAYLEEYRTILADIKTVNEELIDAGATDVIAVQFTTGQPSGSAHEVGHRQAIIFTLRGERVCRAREYPTKVTALEAAGLRE